MIASSLDIYILLPGRPKTKNGAENTNYASITPKVLIHWVSKHNKNVYGFVQLNVGLFATKPQLEYGGLLRDTS